MSRKRSSINPKRPLVERLKAAWPLAPIGPPALAPGDFSRLSERLADAAPHPSEAAPPSPSPPGGGEGTCWSCCHWLLGHREVGGAKGICRRYPPTVLLGGQAYPATPSHARCGEWASAHVAV